MNNIELSIVIPVFNNLNTLEITLKSIIDVLKENNGLVYEIVFVNDGSTDGSLDELLRLKNSYSEIIKCIDLSRNFGQFGALTCGFKYAVGDAVICISADLQDPVGLIPTMISSWRGGSEIVICHRSDRHDGCFNSFASRIAYAISRYSYVDLPSGGFDYWLMSSKISKMLIGMKGKHNFMQGYLVALGFPKTFIPYERQKRQSGKSGYKFSLKLRILVDFICDTTYLPIRVFSAIGMSISILGFIYAIFILYAWLNNNTPFDGWAPIMMLILVMSGLTMLMLGMIGEYIWRIYDNQRDFPIFIEKDIY